MSDDNHDTGGPDKRRRKKAPGLRVPSDNVPRPSTPRVDAQSAEDPQLAVSVAYSFGETKESEEETAGAATSRASTEPLPEVIEAPIHDSVDIDVDDFEDEGGEASPHRDTIPDMAAVLPPSDLAGAVAEPVPKPRGKGASSRWPRVRTEALSDVELEDMIVDGEAAAKAEANISEVPAAVAALERDAIRSPDDSGEILSDELVDELEKSASKTLELTGSDIEELDEEEPAEDVAAKAPPPAPEKTASVPKRAAKAWFEEIFDEDYLRTLPFLTPQTTQAEATFVIDSLAAEPGAQVLDVGCGYGRHAMELAARGYHVVGLDSSLPLLLRGADEAQRRSLNINFIHGDMREIAFEAQFDGAYCLSSTFGYFDDETNKRTALNISRALKPGGRLVLEVLNRDYIIGDLPSRVWWEGDGCVVLEEVEFNYFSSRILSNRSVVFDDGRQLEQEISIRAYSLHELGKLLHAAGFRVIEVSGGMHCRGRFFGGRSRDIVVVAERRSKSRSARATSEGL